MAEAINDATTVMAQLADAIECLKVTRVPPPLAFAGIPGDGNINEFFKIFEKYAHSIYKKDTDS